VGEHEGSHEHAAQGEQDRGGLPCLSGHQRREQRDQKGARGDGAHRNQVEEDGLERHVELRDGSEGQGQGQGGHQEEDEKPGAGAAQVAQQTPQFLQLPDTLVRGPCSGKSTHFGPTLSGSHGWSN
jgi:hypothetical protein